MEKYKPVIIGVEAKAPVLEQTITALRSATIHGDTVAIELDPSTAFIAKHRVEYDHRNATDLSHLGGPRQIPKTNITVSIERAKPKSESRFFSFLDPIARKSGLKLVKFDSQIAVDSVVKEIIVQRGYSEGVRDAGNGFGKISEEDIDFITKGFPPFIKSDSRAYTIDARRQQLMLARVLKSKPKVIVVSIGNAIFLSEKLGTKFDYYGKTPIEKIQEITKRTRRSSRRALLLRRKQKFFQKAQRLFRRK